MRTFVAFLAAAGFLITLVSSWSSASSSLLVTRATAFPATCSASRRQLALVEAPFRLGQCNPQRRKDRFLVRSVQARAVDMDDSNRQSIVDEVESVDRRDVEDGLETSFETAAIDTDMREMAQKILNAVFLTLCFGWAAYTILNIDAGMTRGWTQSEIAMRIPLDNWSNYESSLMEKPIMTKTLINVVIYTLGDWLSQTTFAKKGALDFDVSRTLRNGFIGT